MDNSGMAVTKRGPISHAKVVVLVIAASIIIMLIGISVKPTEEVNGYGVAWSNPPSVISTNLRAPNR